MKKWKIGWGVTSECNMNCQFCYSKKVREDKQFVTLEKCIQFIDNNHEQIEAINYGTGESSLSSIWFKLIHFISKKYPDIQQAVTSNGYLVEKIKKNQWLENVFLDSISEIDVSLDFAKRDLHNQFRGNNSAYQWAIELLEYCSQNEKTTTIVFIGTNKTLEERNLAGLFEIAKKYNAKLRMNIFRPTTNEMLHNKEFIADYDRIVKAIKYINENHCVLSLSDKLFNAMLNDNDIKLVNDPSGTESIRILPDGSITPSTYLITDQFRTKNISDLDSLEQLLEYDIFKKMQENPIPKKCHECPLLNKCGGGVIDRRFLWYNSLSERDPYCPYRKGNYIPDFKIKNIVNDVVSIHDGYLPTMFFGTDAL